MRVVPYASSSGSHAPPAKVRRRGGTSHLDLGKPCSVKPASAYYVARKKRIFMCSEKLYYIRSVDTISEGGRRLPVSPLQVPR